MNRILLLILLIANIFAQTNDPIAYYPFNGNANDESGNGYNGTVNGALLTEDRFGNSNSAYVFDGTDFIDVGNEIIPTKVFSVSLWFKINDIKLMQSFIGNYKACSVTNDGFAISYQHDNENIHNGDIKLIFYNLGAARTETSHTIEKHVNLNDGLWHHVVCNVSTDSFSLYLDNEFVGQANGSYDPTNNRLLLGSEDNDCGFPIDPEGLGERGALDDVRIYNHTLSSEDVSALYNEVNPNLKKSIILTSPDGGEEWIVGSTQNITWTSENVENVKIEYSTTNGSSWSLITSSTTSDGSYEWTIPNTPSISCFLRISDINDELENDLNDSVFRIIESSVDEMIAYFPFNGNANDESSNSNHGIVSGATLTEDRFGNANSAYRFDGIDDAIEILHNDELNFDASIDQYSISFWVKSPKQNSSNGANVISKGFESEKSPLDLKNLTDYSLVSNIKISNSGYQITYGSISDDRWHHIVFIVDGVKGEMQGYIDGYVKLPLSYDNSVAISNTESIIIGGSEGNFFEGSLDDISIYNYILDESEINDLLFENGWIRYEYIEIFSPNGGQNWQTETDHYLYWIGITENSVELEYSNDNGNTWNLIDGNVYNNGSYWWNIPSLQTGEYLIKVTDIMNESIYDICDSVFSILNPSSKELIIQTPNGGEYWNPESVQEISWSSRDIENIQIVYSSNNGSIWNNIVSSYSASEGSYEWTIPVESSDSCLIRVSDINDSSIFDNSDGFFTISGNLTEVLFQLDMSLYAEHGNFKPDSHKVYVGGSFNSFLTTDEMSDNDKDSIYTFTKILEKNSSYEYKYYYESSTWESLDDRVLTIEDQDTIMLPVVHFNNQEKLVDPLVVNEPNGGEVYEAGSQVTISWYFNIIDSVRLEYSIDNGINWTLISTTIENNGSDYEGYLWKVPSIPSTQCLIKVSDSNDPQIFDISDDVFTITDLVSDKIDVSFQVDMNVYNEYGNFNPDTDSVFISGGFNDWSTFNWMVDDNDDNVYTITKVLEKNAGYEYKYLFKNSFGSTWESLASRNLETNNDESLSLEKVYFNNLVTQADTFNIYQPAGGEVLTAGNNYLILWRSKNLQNPKLEYSVDNGQSWSTINNSLNASVNSYSWTVPGISTTECLIKISAIDNPEVYDIVDETMTIVTESSSGELVAYYTFNSNTNDLSGKGYHASIVGDNAYLEDRTLKLLGGNFSGLSIPNNAINYLTNFTISSNVRLTDNSNHKNVLFGAISTDNSAYFEINYSPDNDNWNYVYENTEYLLPDNNIVEDGNWHHVVFVRDGSNIELYIDGVPLNYNYFPTSFNYIQADDGGVIIGQYQNEVGGSSILMPWIGNVDDFRIFNYALNQSEVTTLYNDEVKSESQVIINLTAPNGGQDLTVGDSQSISWASENIDSVKIEYSIDNGNNWTVIVSSTESDGNYEWTIPNVESDQCLIRISDASDVGIFDVSENVFSIFKQKEITLLTPGGGIKQTGKTLSISWTSQSVDSVKLEYSTNSGNTWSTIIGSIQAANGSYNWTIPEVESSNCKIRISDVNDTSVFSESSEFMVFIYPATVSISNNQTFGSVTNSNNYRMLSLPGNINKSINSMISGSQGTDWEVYYDNGAASDYFVRYNGSALFNFTPGKGFWVISRNEISVSEDITSVILNDDNYYIISLHVGWNIIGNPFNKTISWSSVQTENNISGNLYDFSGNFSSTTLMEPYKGYYYLNVENKASLSIPYIIQNEGSLSKKSENILIGLFDDEKLKSFIEIGFNDSSKIGYDKLDKFAPPGDFENERIVLHNHNLETEYKYLYQDFRKPNTEIEVYNIIVKNSESKKLLILLSNIEQIHDDKEIYLMDIELGKEFNLREENKFVINRVKSENKFKLVIGEIEKVNEILKDYLPQEYILFQNYPNPFNPTTVIRYSLPEKTTVSLEVFNLLGERVANLLQNKVEEAGNYEVVFEASNLNSGIYFYRITTNKFTTTKKMILLK